VADLAVYAADIGSIKSDHFGWAGVEGGSCEITAKGKKIDALVDSIASDLQRRPVALGFECPLWIPVHADSSILGSARPGEGKHPWSAGAGAAVMASGLVQITWILDQLRLKLPKLKAHTDWRGFRRASGQLFLWEAFVAGSAKDASDLSKDMDPDVRDAIIAATAFAADCKKGPPPGTVEPGEGTGAISIVGAALLHAGLVDDLSILRRHCHVLKVGAK